MRDNGSIDLKFIRTNEQIADVFTEPLAEKIFYSWITEIMGSSDRQNHFERVYEREKYPEEQDSETDEAKENKRDREKIIVDLAEKKRVAKKRAKRAKKT